MFSRVKKDAENYDRKYERSCLNCRIEKGNIYKMLAYNFAVKCITFSPTFPHTTKSNILTLFLVLDRSV